MKKSALLMVVLLVALTASTAVVYADKKIDFGIPGLSGVPNHRLDPDQVTVKVDETVRFQVHGFHQVLVYEVPAGTTPDDVNIDAVSITVDGEVILNTNIIDGEHAPPFFIHDHSDRFIAEGGNPREYDTVVVDRDEGLSINLTFMIPGSYLVICGVGPHTVNDRMIGIITVKPRGGNK